MPRKGLLVPLALAAVVALTGAACRQDMHDTPRVEANEATDAFEDGRGNRPLVEGTVARGWLNDDEQLTTGKVDGKLVDEFPFPVTREVLERGQQRFNAFCTPCHGKTGMGNGMIVQRGLKPPPSFHDQRLRAAPAGYYFDVMSNGFGVMQDYRAQVDVPDEPIADWETLKRVAPNPLVPTYGEAIAAALTDAERERLDAHMNALAAAGTPTRCTMATAFLRALRP